MPIAELSKQSSIRGFWWLWIGLFVLAILLIRIVAAIGKRRRLALSQPDEAHKAKAIKDAWVEAGKRAEPIEEEEEP